MENNTNNTTIYNDAIETAPKTTTGPESDATGTTANQQQTQTPQDSTAGKFVDKVIKNKKKICGIAVGTVVGIYLLKKLGAAMRAASIEAPVIDPKPVTPAAFPELDLVPSSLNEVNVPVETVAAAAEAVDAHKDLVEAVTSAAETVGYTVEKVAEV